MAEDKKELSEIEKIKQRIAELDKQAEKYAQKSSQYSKKRLKEVQAEIVEQEKLLDLEKKAIKLEEERIKNQKALAKEQATFGKSFAKLNGDIKKLLRDQNTESSIYQSIGNDIAQSKVKQLSLTGDELDAEMDREQFLSEINASLLQQAKETAKAEASARGLNEFEQRRLELKENLLGLSDEQLEKAEAALQLQEQMYLKQERYNQLQQGGADIMGKLPAGLQSVIGGIRGMITGIRAFGVQAAIATAGITLVIGAIVAGLDYFMSLEQAAEDFRKETGVTNSMMGEMNETASSVAQKFGTYGVSIEDAFGTMAALRNEMGEIAEYSEAAVASLTLMKTNFGVSAETAAKVQGVFENVGGLSQDTAANVQMQVAQMSKLAGVAPKKVLQDIAENAEAASTFFKGDLTALSKNAVQAARMGTSLKQQVSLAEKLLDFEGGIEEELTAATYVGGQFNLSRARALAMEGKLAEANEETLKQIQRSGDFRKQDYFTQQQLAKAANMSVEEITKQLNTQEKLSKLSDDDLKKAQAAIDAGLDITDINDEQLMQEVEKAAAQKEMASTITDMENTFKGILATVGGALVPVFNMLAPILKVAFFPLKLAAKALEFIIDGIMWLLKKIPFVGGLVEGIGSLASGIDSAVTNASFDDMVSSAEPAADISSPASGKTRVSTKEGGLFELSSNDDLVAAPGAAAALANSSNGEGGGNGGVNLSVLAAPLQAVVTEIKALRADLSAGKIAVYMDSQKVTNGVSRTVDQSTRNSYNLGTV